MPNLPTKNIPILLLFLFCFVAQVQVLKAQSNSFDLEKIELFSNSNEIVNGEKWVYTKKYVGHPFWNDDKWYKCDVSFKNILYENVGARYDTHTDKLILFIKINDEAHSFILNKQYLNWFVLYEAEKGTKTTFEYGPLVNGQEKLFYTTYYDGHTRFCVQYKKYVNNVVKENYTGEYTPRARMFVAIEGVNAEFDSQKSLLKLFGDRKDDLKKFMRKNKIKVDRKNPTQLTSVFRYYDSLISTQ